MKKLTLFLFLLGFASTSAWAQTYPIDKGSILIGGSASLSSTESGFSDDRVNQLFINPMAQFFVTPGLAVGGEAFFSTDFQSGNAFGVGPAVSYYLGGPESTVYPFAGGSLLYAKYNNGDDVSSLAFRFSAGAALMIAKNVAITGEAYYQVDRLDADALEEPESRNQFGLAFGIAAFVF